MMPPSIVRPLLRAIAILIAITGLMDPAGSVDLVPPQRVTVVTAVAGAAGDLQSAVVEAVGRDAEVRERRPAGSALPCAPDQPCVVIADGSVDLDLPSDLRASTSLVTVVAAAGPNVELSAAIVSSDQHSAAAGSIRVQMTGTGLSGRRTDVRVIDGSAIVGSATHEWRTDGPAAVDVRWWPIAEGARVLRVEAVPADGEVTAIDNSIEAAVTVHASRMPVLVFEPRPSWASTFVRRVLEDDPRFAVRSRARLGPTLVAETSSTRLDATALQSAAVVIVGAPDALSSLEVELLDRYVRARGGTLVLLPDRAPAGASSRLFPGRWTEHLSSIPESIGPMRATEILRRPAVDPTDIVLGSSSGLPAIVMSAAGTGRVVVVGTMDAWRYRDANEGAFDRFWRGIVVEAGAQGAELGIQLRHTLAAAGTTVPFEVRSRHMQPPKSETVRATVRCGEGAAQMIRLWPQGEPGAYAGQWPVGDASECQLDVSIAGGPSASTSLAVVRAPTRGVKATLANLDRIVAATGGVSVVAGEEQKLGEHLRARPPGSAVRTSTRPMHSPWWILPFAACLAGEWWLRRRDGLR